MIKMDGATNTNRIFIAPSLYTELARAPERFRQGRLCQSLLLQMISRAYRDRVFSGVGEALTTLAQDAYVSRRLDLIKEASRALIELPLSQEYNTAGRYFDALERLRRGDRETAEKIFNSIISEPPNRYTARALQSLGCGFQIRQDFSSALKLYAETVRLATNKQTLSPVAALYAQQSIAIIKGTNGDHKGAVEDLEKTLPLSRAIGWIHPAVRYDTLNSLAVEWAEVGRLQQARWASEITLRSPFASAYPNWRETFDDIAWKQRRATRSIVAGPRPANESDCPPQPNPRETRAVCSRIDEAQNLLRLPERRRPSDAELKVAASDASRARLLSFEQWKSKTRLHSPPLEGLSRQERSEMTIGEKLIRLMDLISHDNTDDETIDDILEAVEAIVLAKRGAI